MRPIVSEPISFRVLVRFCLVAIFLSGLCFYIVWQARFLLEGPHLELTNTPPAISNERSVILEGAARNITTITLNGRSIFTNPTGEFRESLVLENGYTIATIAATDRYGRITTIERGFTYLPASRAPETNGALE